jgi:hypothetical protein
MGRGRYGTSMGMVTRKDLKPKKPLPPVKVADLTPEERERRAAYKAQQESRQAEVDAALRAARRSRPAEDKQVISLSSRYSPDPRTDPPVGAPRRKHRPR